MELCRGQVTAFADDETAVLGPVRENIDEALEAPEPRLERVLVLMWPRFVLGDVLAAVAGCQHKFSSLIVFDEFDLLGKTEIDGIKRHDQILSIVYLFESSNNARLAAHRPGKVLVGDGVLQAHAFLGDVW